MEHKGVWKVHAALGNLLTNFCPKEKTCFWDLIVLLFVSIKNIPNKEHIFNKQNAHKWYKENKGDVSQMEWNFYDKEELPVSYKMW